MRLLIPLLLLAALVAEEAPRQLDPSKPADAWQIVATVCAQSQMKVADAQVVLIALQTLKPDNSSPAPVSGIAPAANPVSVTKPEASKP